MRGHLRKTKLLLLAVFAGILVLAACGQKGPLYLPDKGTKAVEKQPEAMVPAPEQQEGSSETVDRQEKSGENAK